MSRRNDKPRVRCSNCRSHIQVESRAEVFLRTGGPLLCPPCQDQVDIEIGDHDERCGGYGGWWAEELDGGAIGWAVNPEDEDDWIGYAMCACMAAPRDLPDQQLS